MSGRINRIPPGLLAVLGTQAQGVNPNDLAQFYQPILEMRDWLLTSAMRYVTCSATGVGAPNVYDINSPADTTTYIVPANETWLFYGASYAVSPAVPLTGQLEILAPSNLGTPSLVPVAVSAVNTSAVGFPALFDVNCPFPIFLPAGSRPRFRVIAHAGTGQTVEVQLRYARLV